MEERISASPWNYERFMEIQKPFQEKIPSILKGMMGRLINMPGIEELCRQAYSQPDSVPFWDCLLRSLGITYGVSNEDFNRIPRRGPLVVVANHPFGAVEGLVLGSVLRSVRADTKILANSILQPIAELQDLFICVDAFGEPGAAHYNFQPLRTAFRWLENGGVLAAFPAGEVTHLRLSRAEITDPNWKNTATRMARRLKLPVLPVYFCGINSLMFQMMGLVHPKVRTALLAREMLNKRNSTIEVRIGKLIPPERLKEFGSDGEATQYLREKTYLLKHRGLVVQAPAKKTAISGINSKNTSPIAPPENPEILEEEILNLGSQNILIDQGNLMAVHASAWEIPGTLREIGRQREIAFRSVGEGSGKSLDLDLYDEYYRHIFLWDKTRKQIGGAYRIGCTDHILGRLGVEGLYVNSLFRLRRSFFNKLGPALELGRSFIRLENQRDNRSLPLLWMGIARFVAKHPKYRYLYGPVSISGNYRSISRQLIARFLRTNHLGAIAPFEVTPVSPPSFSGAEARAARAFCKKAQSLDDLSALISDIEPDSKGVPVLLRHYIRLGAKVLSFNIDADFGNCLDALILVDLARVDGKILERLMGKSASIHFRLWHDAQRVECTRAAS